MHTFKSMLNYILQFFTNISVNWQLQLAGNGIKHIIVPVFFRDIIWLIIYTVFSAAVKQKNVHMHMGFFRRTVWVNGS